MVKGEARILRPRTERLPLAAVAVQAEDFRGYPQKGGLAMIKVPAWFKAMLPAPAADFWLVIRLKFFGLFASARVHLRWA
jgi:hypothetical protein